VTLVRWTLYALVLAEESGATRESVDAVMAGGQTPLSRLSADERGLLARALGVSAGWGTRAIKAVGSYGEMYERNVGAGSPLNIERGLNRLWSQGGLMYAPPID
jgi:general L-amino acid transport system substrate-binding protein